MSDYRDDSVDTVVASDATWLGLSAMAESAVRIASVLLVAIGVAHTDAASAADEVVDRIIISTEDSAQVSGAALQYLRASVLIEETALAADGQVASVSLLHEDGAAASDQTMHALRALQSDSASVGDAALAARRATDSLESVARIADALIYRVQETAEDGASASDLVAAVLVAHDVPTDSAAVADSVLDGHTAPAAIAEDAAQAGDTVIDQLHAADLAADSALTADRVVTEAETGQAWTADVDGWPMSRYAPYSFRQLVVIDGVPHGINDAGVFALDAETEEIDAALVTGLMDIGAGGLVHPLGAYMEYELAGTATMDVTQTQTGAAQTYTYALSGRQADAMTSGRFIFGRGLRGRRFAFALRIAGTKAEINDLSIDIAQTKRRL
jgi:hypothetical protein